MSDISDTIESQLFRLPSVRGVLETTVPFPFEGKEGWAEAFNHLQFVKGEGFEVKVEKENSQAESSIFKITLPEKPTLSQIIKATRLLIGEANIDIDINSPSLSELFIFCRQLRNTARVLAEIVNPSSNSSEQTDNNSLKQPDQTQILEFIDSLYQLGVGLETAVKEGFKTEEESKTSSPPITSFDDERLKNYEPPPFVSEEKTDEPIPQAKLIKLMENYKNQLLLNLIGKNYQSFAPENQEDEKLSQVVQNSTYYFLLERYWRIKEGNGKKRPLDVNKQIEEFDQWLLAHKKFLLSLLFSSPPQASTTESQESQKSHQRTLTAFWEITIRNIFSYLDQAIVEEGWKKAKKNLKPPPLFNDLGEDVQRTLEELGLSPETRLEIKDQQSLSPNLSEDTQKVLKELGLLTETKSGLEDKQYSSTSLFKVAQQILKKKKEDNPDLSTLEKIGTLWDLVQVYEYQKTFKLTTAVEKKAFECNLRSYILGHLYHELMRDEVKVYVVNPPSHALLLVFDQSANKAYCVDPTIRRFIYEDGRRIPWFTQPFVKKLDDQLWQSILSQINASPDNFNIFGYFNIYGKPEFATILPFRQGIESGFFTNIGNIYYDQFKEEDNKTNRLQLISKAHYFYQKALELNPNYPGYHNNLAKLYTQIDLAEAVVRKEADKTNGEKLTEEEAQEVDKLHLSNLLKAEAHCREALRSDPNYSIHHNNLAILYTKIALAEAIVRKRVGKTNGEKLTEEEAQEVDKLHLSNLLKAEKHYQKALELKPNNPGYHYNLAKLYTTEALAEAVVRRQVNKTKGEELTPEETQELNNLYQSNLLKAKEHLQKALELNPNDQKYHEGLDLINQKLEQSSKQDNFS